jgi:RNA polymerase sigma-70 factor (family 1)
LLSHNIIYDLQMRIALSEDMQAYKELYLLMFDKLHKFSYSFVKSKEVAEELVSDVFIKLWQMRDQLVTIQNLKVYLYSITKNLSLNYLTKASKMPATRLDQINVESIIEFKNPESVYISNETIRDLVKTIQELPPQCRIIFLLVRDQGLAYKEVAKILNVSVFTVRNQVAIATKKIAESLPLRLQFALQFQDTFSAS